jgi:hypothetical protein
VNSGKRHGKSNDLGAHHLGSADWTNFELYFRETFEQIALFGQSGLLRLANPEHAQSCESQTHVAGIGEYASI